MKIMTDALDRLAGDADYRIRVGAAAALRQRRESLKGEDARSAESRGEERRQR